MDFAFFNDWQNSLNIRVTITTCYQYIWRPHIYSKEYFKWMGQPSYGISVYWMSYKTGASPIFSCSTNVKWVLFWCICLLLVAAAIQINNLLICINLSPIANDLRNCRRTNYSLINMQKRLQLVENYISALLSREAMKWKIFIFMQHNTFE